MEEMENGIERIERKSLTNYWIWAEFIEEYQLKQRIFFVIIINNRKQKFIKKWKWKWKWKDENERIGSKIMLSWKFE